MSDSRSQPTDPYEDKISLLALGSVFLRWRWLIVGMGLLGGLYGLTRGLTSKRVYKSTAVFIPQGAEGGAATALASQFGFRMPSSGAGWGPPVYVELLHARALLEPIATAPVPVKEEGGKLVALADLLRIQAPNREQRVGYTVERLKQILSVSEDKKLNAVKVSAVTEWPSVSLALVERAVAGVNAFNLQTRKSQAGAERQFAAEQAARAEMALRQAEDAAQMFLQRNRAFGSPELQFEKDRLGREVSLRQQVYTSLLQNAEEARLREVRDTPVITILESPRLAVFGEPRNSARKAVVGGLLWGVLAILLAFLIEGLRRLRRLQSPEAREFFDLLDGLKPRLPRRTRA